MYGLVRQKVHARCNVHIQLLNSLGLVSNLEQSFLGAIKEGEQYSNFKRLQTL